MKKLFINLDENKIKLIDGAILETARLKIELDNLHDLINKTGLIKYNPVNMAQQKELEASKLITKVRANYLNYIAKLTSIMGENIEDDDESLSEYE